MHLIVWNKWIYIYDFLIFIFFIFNYHTNNIKKDLLKNYNIDFYIFINQLNII